MPCQTSHLVVGLVSDACSLNDRIPVRSFHTTTDWTKSTILFRLITAEGIQRCCWLSKGRLSCPICQSRDWFEWKS